MVLNCVILVLQVVDACKPLTSTLQEHYHGLEGVQYESKQWAVQVMVMLSRLRLDKTEGIDFDAVFRKNLDVHEAQVR